MCDSRRTQPWWNHSIISVFSALGWQDVSTSYYRMNTGTILPTHRDRYVRYVELHGLQGRELSIRRAVVYLENWRPGHYAEFDGEPYVSWRAGDAVIWQYDLPHMAANLGLDPRYTVQVTGHL